MIIERLDLIAFGRFTDKVLNLDAGPRRFHLVYGPNESGKSTSLRAIHSLLYGMPYQSDDNYLHHYKSMRVGARLVDAAGGRALECVRRRGRGSTLSDPHSGKDIDSALLAELLHGVEADTFSRQFGISHQELTSGGRAILDGGGDLGEMLFSAGTGTAALRTIRQQLLQERQTLFVPRGSSGELNKLISKYNDSITQLRGQRLLMKEYDDRHRARDQAIASATQLKQQLQSQVAGQRQLEAYHQALQLLPDWTAVTQQLEQLHAVPLLDDDFVQRRRSLEAAWQTAHQRQQSLTDQLQELIEKQQRLSVDDRWLPHGETIQTLAGDLRSVETALPKLRKEQTQLQRLEEQVADLQSQLQAATATASDVATSAAESAFSTAQRAEIDRLVSQHSGLQEALQASDDKLVQYQQRITTIDEQLQALPPLLDPAPLTQSLETLGNPKPWLDSVAKANTDAAAASDAADLALRRLRGFSGTLEQAVAFLPPSESVLAQHIAALQTAQADCQRHEAAVQVAQTQATQAADALAAEQTEQSLPSPDQLQAQRTRRDQLLHTLAAQVADDPAALRGQPLLQLADEIRLADQIADQLCQSYDQVLRRQLLAGDVEKTQRTLSVARDAHQAAQQQSQQHQLAWLQLWNDLGVAAGTLDEMRVWQRDLTSLQQLAQQLRTCQDQHRNAVAQQQHHLQQLQSALRAVGCQNPLAASDSLTDVYALATGQRQQLAQQLTQRSEWEQQQQRLQAEFETETQLRVQRQRQWDKWQTRWSDLTASLASAQTQPDQIHAWIRLIDDLQNVRQQRRTVKESLQSQWQQMQTLTQHVSRLCDQLDLPTPPSVGEFDHSNSDPAASIDHLATILRDLVRGNQHAVQQQTQHQLLQQQIETLQQKQTEAAGEHQQAQTQLQQLCKEAKCTEIDDLPEIERLSQQRRYHLQESQQLERSLREWAGQQPLSEFLQLAAEHDPAAIDIERQKAQLEAERLQAAWSEAEQQVGRLQAAVDLMDASDQVAQIQQSQQHDLAMMRRLADRYAQLTIAEQSLQQAIDHYRANNQGDILRLAAEYFQQLTNGEYADLQVEIDDKDRPRLAAVRPATRESVLAHLLSDGTADALYLSLRLASLRTHLDKHSPLPLIVDDCLVQFDDDRAIAALKIFSDLSLHTQIILFTHHQHLIDLASEQLGADQVHFHSLDKPLAGSP